MLSEPPSPETKLGFEWVKVGLSEMGGGNGQKSKTARERNMEKTKAAKGISFFYFSSCLPFSEIKKNRKIEGNHGRPKSRIQP